MKSLVFLAILILTAGFAYIGFSVVTFEPEPPRRYNLTVQTDEVDLSGMKPPLNVQEQKKKDSIVQFFRTAMREYESDWNNIPDQAQGVITAMKVAIMQGKLPAYYPVSSYFSTDILDVSRNYTILRPLSRASAVVSDTAQEDALSEATCTEGEGFLIGDTGSNVLRCNRPTNESMRVYLSGPGDDQIMARGNALIDAGPGNDRIILGKELAIIYVSPNFGSDIVKVDCAPSPVIIREAVDIQRVIPWQHEYANMIVFDSQIAKKDITISDNTLTHNTSGDSIVINDNCFNVVFMAE